MRGAVIQNGEVVNVITLPSDFRGDAWNGDLLVVSDVARIGDSYEDGEFIHPPRPEPEPEPLAYTSEELFDLLEPEYDSILDASKTDKRVAFFFDKLRTRSRAIRADNPKLKQGLDLYASLGLITQKKRDAIINGDT